MIESATFWQNGPEIETGEMRTEDIKTEVFFMPAAAHTEKSGSFTNTQRMLQWHHTAVEPAGDARSDLWFTYHLGRRIREKLAAAARQKAAAAETILGEAEALEMDRPVLDLTWDYPTEGRRTSRTPTRCWPRSTAGTPTASRSRPTPSSNPTARPPRGCWIYCGVRAGGVNQAARRKPGQEQNWVANEWGWAWPANRRVLYNRASADPDGKPWSERKALVWWDEEQGKWTGHDIPDFVGRPAAVLPAAARAPPGWPRSPASTRSSCRRTARPGCSPRPAWWTARCPRTTSRRNPRCPTCSTAQQHNPVREIITDPQDRFQPSGAEPGSEIFPYVTTTYRLTEHHTAGGMSRFLPYLAELQPAFFCEVSPELAAERGLEHMGWATIITARSAIEARVMVTRRMKPLRAGGRTVHQVGLPWHWGPNGLTTGDAANELSHLALDPNVHIQEVKAMAVDIQPGRRPRGPALRDLIRSYQQRAGHHR